MTDRPVRSPSGGIQVLTTERGLPLQLKLAQRELSKAPQDLAHEILALCQLSAKRAQVARRRHLVERGFSPNVIRGLNLTTEEELSRAEAELRGDGDGDGPPETWMRSV